MQGAWPEEWVGPGVGKPLGRRALPTGSLLPPRHSAEPAPALKQHLLACEPTASHPCCGGEKGCHPPCPSRGCPWRVSGKEEELVLLRWGSQWHFQGAQLKTPRAALRRSVPLPRPKSEAQAPPLAWLPLPRALLASAQFSLRAETQRPTGERAPSSRTDGRF